MGRTDAYQAQLQALDRHQWDDFLLANSGLPGPRANIELARAVAREGEAARFRGQQTFPVLRELLQSTGVAAGRVELYAAGLGPGVFSGLRIALAAARAMALPGGTAVRGVSSGEALALEQFEQGVRPPLAVVGDARRERLWLALFDWDGGVSPDFNQTQSEVGNHQNLLALQGGNGVDEFYHFNAAEYADLQGAIPVINTLEPESVAVGPIPTRGDLLAAGYQPGSRGLVFGADGSLWWCADDGVNGWGVGFGILGP